MKPGCRRFEKLNQRLPMLVGLLCVVQPLLDIAAYWNRELGISSTWTSALRLLLLFGCFAVGFLVTERRRSYAIFSAVVLCYLGGHVLACLGTDTGCGNWVEDLTDQLRTLVMPVTALSLMSCLRANPKVLPTLLKTLTVNLGVILLVMGISTLTGTDPHTYEAKEIGVRGWFHWTSAQSAVLSLLCPLVLAWTLERFPGRLLPLAAACLLSFGALFLFGTRLAYASLAASGLCMTACLLLGGRSRLPQALTVLAFTALFLCLLPVSPMLRNQEAVEENARIKQERIDAAVSAVSDGAVDSSDPAVLRAAYRYNIQGMVDRFGIDAVSKAYEHTLDAGRICDDRLRKLRFCQLLMAETAGQTPLARLFGLEIGRTRVDSTEVYYFETDEWKQEAEAYDPENDILGVFYLCGWVGLILCVLFLGAFALRAAVFLRRLPRALTDPALASFLIAFAIALVYACSTVSVLRRNNASVYLAFVLSGLWYLTRPDRPDLPGSRKELSQ